MKTSASWLLVATACIGLSGSVGCSRTPRSVAPALPVIAQANTDPQIAAVIARAKTRVVAEPESGAAWGLLGSTLMAHKFHKEALHCFEQAERLQPNEPRWPYLHGMILLWENANAAIPKLERAVELTTNISPTPRLRLADALLERGRLEEAEKHLLSLAKEHPADPYVLLGLGKLSLAREHLDKALDYLMQSAESEQTAQTSLALVAGILHRLGNAVAAAEASSRVAALSPDPAMVDSFLWEVGELQTGMQAWLARAERLARTDPRESLALLEKAVAVYPNSAASWRMLGQARIKQRDADAAEKSLRKAAELSPEDSVTHYQLGTVLGAKGRFGEAADCFRKSIKLRPTDASGHFHLGQCLSREGKRGEAIEAYRAAVRYDSTFAAAYLQLGALLGEEGRFDEATDVLTRAVALNLADAQAARTLEQVQRFRDSKRSLPETK